MQLRIPGDANQTWRFLEKMEQHTLKKKQTAHDILEKHNTQPGGLSPNQGVCHPTRGSVTQPRSLSPNQGACHPARVACHPTQPTPGHPRIAMETISHSGWSSVEATQQTATRAFSCSRATDALMADRRPGRLSRHECQRTPNVSPCPSTAQRVPVGGHCMSTTYKTRLRHHLLPRYCRHKARTLSGARRKFLL